MSKKTNEKKKVNIKLNVNQSYMVDDIETFMHIQKTYADLLRSAKVESEREVLIAILDKLNEAFANLFTGSINGDGDEW
jgi:hypothetical protein